MLTVPPQKWNKSESRKRRGVSCETTSTKDFSVEDQPQNGSFNAYLTLSGYPETKGM
jgi:hypothetical protein